MSLCNQTKRKIPIAEWAHRRRLAANRNEEETDSSPIVKRALGNTISKPKTNGKDSTDPDDGSPVETDENDEEVLMDVDNESDEIDAAGNLKGFVVPDDAPLEYDTDASVIEVDAFENLSEFSNVPDDDPLEYDSDTSIGTAPAQSSKISHNNWKDQVDAYGNLKGFVVPDDALLEYDSDASDEGFIDGDTTPKVNGRIRGSNDTSDKTTNTSVGRDFTCTTPQGDIPLNVPVMRDAEINAEAADADARQTVPPITSKPVGGSFARFEDVMKQYFAFMSSAQPGVTGTLEMKADGGVNVTIWNRQCPCDGQAQSAAAGGGLTNESLTSEAPTEHMHRLASAPMSDDDIPLTQLRSRARTTKRRRERLNEETEERGPNAKRVRMAELKGKSQILQRGNVQITSLTSINKCTIRSYKTSIHPKTARDQKGEDGPGYSCPTVAGSSTQMTSNSSQLSSVNITPRDRNFNGGTREHTVRADSSSQQAPPTLALTAYQLTIELRSWILKLPALRLLLLSPQGMNYTTKPKAAVAPSRLVTMTPLAKHQSERGATADEWNEINGHEHPMRTITRLVVKHDAAMPWTLELNVEESVDLRVHICVLKALPYDRDGVQTKEKGDEGLGDREEQPTKRRIPIAEWARRRRLASKRNEDTDSSSYVGSPPGSVISKTNTIATDTSLSDDGGPVKTEDDEDAPMDVDKTNKCNKNAAGKQIGIAGPEAAPVRYDSDTSMGTIISGRSNKSSPNKRKREVDAYGNLRGFVVPDESIVSDNVSFVYDSNASDEGSSDEDTDPEANRRGRRLNIANNNHAILHHQERSPGLTSMASSGRATPGSDTPITASATLDADSNANVKPTISFNTPRPDETLGGSFAQLEVMKQFFVFMAGPKLGVTGALEVKPDGGIYVTVWNSQCPCDAQTRSPTGTGGSLTNGSLTAEVTTQHRNQLESSPISDDDVPLSQFRSRARINKRRRERLNEEAEDRASSAKRARRA
ncbi:hypothetical protein BKA70DRAFT_1216004 [Coprinopsis sp. MPI-PUGE-AT-0042]|nr:hypothetical protein BKA70DRAFT_1216004 [Coprinopsis sp. MPI-PUGE-AT-0042]